MVAYTLRLPRLSLAGALMLWLGGAAASASAQPAPAGPTPAGPSAAAASAAAPADRAAPAAAAEDDAVIDKIVALRRAGRFSEAFAVAKGLTQQRPASARAWHELGTLYALHGQLEDAAAAFERAVALDPVLHAARMSLAEVLRADRRYRPALEHYQALYAAPDVGLEARRGAAICLLALDRRDEAKAALTALQQADPNGEIGQWAGERLAALAKDGAGGADIASLDAQTEAHFRAGRYREAADAAGMACSEAPSAPRCYRAAVSLLALRDYLAAVGALRAALRCDPGHLPSLSAWPTALRKLRGEGAGGLDVSLRHPQPAQGLRRAALALLDGDLLLAERLADDALSQAPTSAILLLVRAEARLRRGATARARVDFRAALGRRPKLEIASAGLLACDLADGRITGVRAALRLPAPPAPPEGVVLPQGYDPNADVRAWDRWRRNTFDTRLRGLADPGIRPPQPFSPPASLDVEALRPDPTTAADAAR